MISHSAHQFWHQAERIAPANNPAGLWVPSVCHAWEPSRAGGVKSLLSHPQPAAKEGMIRLLGFPSQLLAVTLLFS